MQFLLTDFSAQIATNFPVHGHLQNHDKNLRSAACEEENWPKQCGSCKAESYENLSKSGKMVKAVSNNKS